VFATANENSSFSPQNSMGLHSQSLKGFWAGYLGFDEGRCGQHHHAEGSRTIL
jgi:hypothetical protein